MLELPESKDINLQDILSGVNKGTYQLPEFQRDWIWDDDRIRGIIASISQGYPMGAILCLKYGNPDIKFKTRFIEGVKEQDARLEYLILDGQQRLTSIYQAAFSKNCVKTSTEKGAEIERYYYLSMEGCLNDEVDRVDAILSIPDDKKLKTNFNRDVVLDLSEPVKEIQNKAFPLNIIFNSGEMMDWATNYCTYYNSCGDAAAVMLFKKFQEEVLKTILYYKLPVITLSEKTPKEAVCRVFENINTRGVSLTVFELVTATFAINGFNLREDWKVCKAKIRKSGKDSRTDLLDSIDETAFLTAVTLYSSYMRKQTGLSVSVSCKKKDVLSLDYNDYIRNREKVVEGFELVREFLVNYQGVYRKRDLPYTTQLIPLAAICAVLGKSACDEKEARDILEKWYWCGVLGEMYGGATEARYANDIEDVINEIRGARNQIRTVNNAFFSSTRLLGLQSRNSAAYKGIMGLLHKKDCQDFMNPMKISKINAMDKPPDIHHIFPQAYCKGAGIPEEKYNSIVNKTPLLAKTNKEIGGHAPSKYVSNIKEKVGLTDEELKKRVESHMVDYDLLKEDNFDAYFIDRAKKLLDLIEKAMGKAVPDRSSDETIRKYGADLS